MERKLDRQRVQDFARKLFGFYTSGLLTLMVQIGWRTGPFEALARGAGLEPGDRRASRPPRALRA